MMRSTCTWREEFSTSRDDINWQDYNKTYVEYQTELLREQEGSTETDYVEVFAKGFHPDDYLIPQVYRIKDFCNGTTLRTVLQSEVAECTASTAWLDEQSYNGGDSRSRVQYGPLTPQGLHARLIRRRFRSRKFSEKSLVEVSTPQPANHKSLKTRLRQCLRQYVHRHKASAPDVKLVSQGKGCVPEEPNDGDDEPDAERRLIFITNIDPPMAKALIRTVSYHQAPSLHDALDKHLAAEAFIGVEFSLIGLSRFRLSFHLPFFSLRFRDERDSRTHGNGESLRHTEDVSFLNWPSARPDLLEFLHEGQISSVIAGPNNLCWEAYCFVDTYFDGEDGESVLDYEQEANIGERMDPLTRGKLKVESPI
ncbi:uncharacterized protein A1O9_00916 [Exophiala aquamarina CBS 119918]|uniref:Uncharacterized protein n=1 Tax=Exophiala aquamarina CBS 119918 TaxID=1182545 RepID=A0A072PT66_9EURO|nr:uncharacterized protein A1O9_00916 [Exophiala aquamarina CBS 119918]KEF62942.1 hypothetical protein A1O9_00916 [Exophiala aquamarina CBS 119918]